MATEQGIVLNTTPDGWAEVITERREACSDCGSSHCCESLVSAGKMITRAENRAAAEPGDLVRLNLGSAEVVKSAALLYMVPLAGLIAGVVAGAVIGRALFSSETGSSVLFGFIGLALGFGMTAAISKLWLNRDGFTPVITGILMRKAASLLTQGAIDPVCKMTVDPDRAPESHHYGDQTYYFCHPACKEAFLRDPGKYLTTSG